MKIRVFGSHECPLCQQIISQLQLQKVAVWEWIDANASDKQRLCDLYDVDILPHVQLLDDNGNVMWQYASQDLTYNAVISKVAELS